MARANSIPDRLLDEARWLATTRQFGDGPGRCRDAVVYRVREHRKKKGIPEAILGIPSSRDETREEAPRTGDDGRTPRIEVGAERDGAAGVDRRR